MILVPFFVSSTAYGSTKNLLSLPFQASVFFALCNKKPKIVFFQKVLVTNFSSHAHFDPWASQKLWVIVI